MMISRLEQAVFYPSYGIFCSAVEKIGDRDGHYSTFCRILPGNSTIPHAHFEPELFYIIQGVGFMTIDGVQNKVYAGTLIRIPAFKGHTLQNIGQDELVFLSVYTEDLEVPMLPSSALITAAPPTPNGPLHLGHISGPYLASDILSRYLRMRGLAVLSHCGTDDHQNYLYEKAQNLKVSAECFRRDMRARIQRGFERLTIQFDEFIEPKTDQTYKNHVLDFMQRAIAKNIIKEEEIALPYCIHCQHALVDVLIEAVCPSCNAKSHGACEQCGIVVPPWQLQHAICSRCKRPADEKVSTLYVFPLQEYLPVVLQQLSNLSLPMAMQMLVKRAANMNNLTVLLTYPASDHEGVIWPESNEVLHVWFEMAAHYERFALNSNCWIHCFGFDNGFYYLLFIPALLYAMHEKTMLPDVVITNQFLQLEERKFSTSQMHAIWADEFIGNVDHLRLYLCLHRPAERPDNFSECDFTYFSCKLEKQLQNLEERARNVASVSKTGVLPSVMMTCNRAMKQMEYLLSPSIFDLRKASREFINFIDFTLDAVQLDNSERILLHVLATLMSCFMPRESARLAKALGERELFWLRDWSHVYEIAES